MNSFIYFLSFFCPHIRRREFAVSMEEYGKARTVGNPLIQANFGATLGAKKERETGSARP
jgi:hypothetical protein